MENKFKRVVNVSSVAQLIVTVNHPQMRPNFNYTLVHQRYVHLCLFSLPLVKSLNNDICIRTASTLCIMMDKHHLMFITLNNYFRNDSRRITVIYHISTNAGKRITSNGSRQFFSHHQQMIKSIFSPSNISKCKNLK